MIIGKMKERGGYLQGRRIGKMPEQDNMLVDEGKENRENAKTGRDDFRWRRRKRKKKMGRTGSKRLRWRRTRKERR